MYDATSNERAKANTSDLNEELGQVRRTSRDPGVWSKGPNSSGTVRISLQKASKRKFFTIFVGDQASLEVLEVSLEEAERRGTEGGTGASEVGTEGGTEGQ